jgi:hypothetical protein
MTKRKLESVSDEELLQGLMEPLQMSFDEEGERFIDLNRLDDEGLTRALTDPMPIDLRG